MDEKSHIQLCRTCLKQLNNKENLLCIYQISDLLMSYTSIKIKENDGLPSKICNSCHKKAYQAYDFKILCEQSEQKLRTSKMHLFNKSVIDDSEVKEEEFDVKIDDCSNAVLQKGVENLKPFGDKPDIEDYNLFVSYHDIPNRNNRKEVQINQIEAVKGNNKQYRCHFCDMNFIQLTRYIKHVKQHEDGLKCGVCDKTFLTTRQLRNHINIHTRKGAHLCQTCGKQFTMPENLIRHQRIHTGIRPYKCKICNKSFTQSNELKSHVVTHSSEKTHLCNVCGNKYARHMSLQIHMRRLHSDASLKRPYCCAICGRAFKDKRDLAQHISIHKGEKKHVCKVCNKAFNRSSNLKVHERIHFGPRPFVCHICQKSFIQKHVLNTHLKTHPS